MAVKWITHIGNTSLDARTPADTRGTTSTNQIAGKLPLALAVAPGGFTVADLAAKVRSLTGQAEADYTVRQAAYDLRKLRGKHLVFKPGRTRRYHVPEQAARTIAALLTLRDQVIAPLLAGVRRPGPGRPPKTRTRIDRDYEHLREDMRTLFEDLALNIAA